jgi:hypothetical protein
LIERVAAYGSEKRGLADAVAADHAVLYPVGELQGASVDELFSSSWPPDLPRVERDALHDNVHVVVGARRSILARPLEELDLSLRFGVHIQIAGGKEDRGGHQLSGQLWGERVKVISTSSQVGVTRLVASMLAPALICHCTKRKGGGGRRKEEGEWD